jgi:hypothetical protein
MDSPLMPNQYSVEPSKFSLGCTNNGCS